MARTVQVWRIDDHLKPWPAEARIQGDIAVLAKTKEEHRLGHTVWRTEAEAWVVVITALVERVRGAAALVRHANEQWNKALVDLNLSRVAARKVGVMDADWFDEE